MGYKTAEPGASGHCARHEYKFPLNGTYETRCPKCIAGEASKKPDAAT